MTQAQAIERGFTHFIEVWRSKTKKEGVNTICTRIPIKYLDTALVQTKKEPQLYTVAIFLIKPKPTHP